MSDGGQANAYAFNGKRKTQPIRYAFARAANDTAISISDYAGGNVTCFGCDRDLVAKAKKPTAKVRSHFAHAVDGEVTCNSETALHRLSKVIVQTGYRAARAAGSSYPITWRCPCCESVHTFDAVKYSTKVLVETRPTAGVQSDLLFLGSRPFALEVVVTHDVQSETAAKYRAADVPVFIVRPTWKTVSALSLAVVTARALGTRRERCPTCQLRDQRVREQIAQLASALKAIQPASAEQAYDLLGPWRRREDIDPLMYPKAREFIVEQASRLTRLGFEPASTKVWEFRFTLPDHLGLVYALVDRDGDRPPWEAAATRFSIALRVEQENVDAFVQPILTFLRNGGFRIGDDWRSIIPVASRSARGCRRATGLPRRGAF